jgi:Clp amino terminal domain, pathogenicity island component
MYERVTNQTRKVMQLANEEAQRFNHEYIGTEHLLLGLLRSGPSAAVNVLKGFGIDVHRVRRQIERIVQVGPGGEQVLIGKLPHTPRAKKVIEYTVEEARSLNHNYVGTEHLLLGLLREEEGVAAQVLMNLGLSLDEVRAAVQREVQRPPVDPAWLSWNGGTVPKIARTIAEGQRWEIMPILADALEEAGCNEVEILNHLRCGFEHGCAEEHGWGCWVLNRLVAFEDVPAAGNVSSPAGMSQAEGISPPERPSPARSWWQFWR